MVAIVSCSDDAAAPTVRTPPLVSHVSVAENQNNALSFVVSIAASDADSARVRYQSTDDTSAVTPFYPLSQSGGYEDRRRGTARFDDNTH